MICSESKFDGEVGFITETFCNNGFPEDIVRSLIGDKIVHFHKTKVALAQKCPVYLRLPWLVEISDQFADQISLCIWRCYFASNLRVVYYTRTALPSGRKDVLPTQHSSALIIFLYMYMQFAVHRENWSTIRHASQAACAN